MDAADLQRALEAQVISAGNERYKRGNFKEQKINSLAEVGQCKYIEYLMLLPDCGMCTLV